MPEQKPVIKASFPHRLTAGLGMVLLAAAWAAGWFARSDAFSDAESKLLLVVISSSVLAAWTLITAVIATGFFHAAGKHPAATWRRYRNASLRLFIVGILVLFPGPIMAQVLGSSSTGRTLALVITAMSISTILLSRARIHVIETRLSELALMENGIESLAPWEMAEKRPSPPKET